MSGLTTYAILSSATESQKSGYATALAVGVVPILLVGLILKFGITVSNSKKPSPTPTTGGRQTRKRRA